MRQGRSRSLRALAAIIIFAAKAPAQLNDCSAVLGAVYDKSVRQGTYFGSHSFESFFCDRTYSSSREARDQGLKVGIDIDGLPISIGGHNKNEAWSSYQREVCNSVRTQSQVSTQWYDAVNAVNARVIAAWESCVNSDRAGLYFWVETDDVSNTVSFNAKWIGLGDSDNAARLPARPISYQPTTALKNCSGTLPQRLGRAIRTVTCERSGAGGATATFKTIDYGDRIVSVPKVLPPAAPPVKPVVTRLCLPAAGFYRIPIRVGESLRIRSGVSTECGQRGWSCDSWATTSGPDGVPLYTHANALMPSQQIGTIVGAFSSSDAADATQAWDVMRNAGPFRVGSSYDGIAPFGGYFYLVFNDLRGSWVDNVGSVNVEITSNSLLNPSSFRLPLAGPR